MSISLFKLKKWVNMLRGRSVYHVNQGVGRIYSVQEIIGYYNDLTEKVTRFPAPGNDVPVTKHDNGAVNYFSIAIFQYGLAAYDLWLQSKNESYIAKFKSCVDWAIENQQPDGAWKTFESQNPMQPYSSMAQGEGISLLARAALHYNKPAYKEAAIRAGEFLLTERRAGGVCERTGNSLKLYEFTYKPLVLNGWIFSAWGLLDLYKLTGDKKYEEAWLAASNSIAEALPDFDCGYWSYYNTGGNFTSPFYHKLHIAMLKVMYDITGNSAFDLYAARWEKQLSRRINRFRAFTVKAVQKIIEK